MANTYIYPYGQSAKMPDGYPIADDLNTDSAQQALSAKQGKKLYDMMNNVIDCPSVLTSYVGDTLQLFKYPLLQGFIDGRNVNISVGTTDVNIRKMGKDLNRYFEFIPTSTGTYTLKLNATSRNLDIIASKEVTVNVVTPTSPQTKKNILFIGDSVTQGTTLNTNGVSADSDAGAGPDSPFSNEVKDLLTSSRTATATLPAGLGLTNIQLIGSLNTNGGRNEGRGGWTTQQYMQSGSPFYIGGKVDFNAYLDQNSIYPDTSHKGVDVIYILLGANDSAPLSIDNGRFGWDMSIREERLINLLTTIKEQLITDPTKTYYNPNLKVVLLGYPYAYLAGFGYHPYGSGQYTDGSGMAKLKSTINASSDKVAAMDEFSSFVSTYRVAAQIDSQYSYAWKTKQVNNYMSKTELVNIEGSHPNAFGYKQMGAAIARHIIGLGL